MKKFIPVFLLIVFHLSLSHPAQAQGRFKASVFGGLNICQLDGDGAGRYNHPGLRAGIGTSFPLGSDIHSPWKMIVELAYTQKGSHIRENNGEISLQYVELPLMLGFYALDEHLRFAAGVAPAVKVGCSVTFGGVNDAPQEARFRTIDWLPVTLSAEYLFSDHLGVFLRYQNSIVSVYNGIGSYRIFRSNHGAFNRLLGVGLTYTF